MTIDEAKFILSALRNEGEGRTDSKVAEALRMAESDSDLGKWFSEIQNFDTIMTEKLHSVPVPADLKTSILTGIKVSQKPKVSRRMVVAFAAAAALVIGLALWEVLNPTNREKVVDFQRDMLQAIDELVGIDHVSDDPSSVTLYLESHGMLTNFSIPGDVNGGKLAGCKIVDWKGHKVSLLCFGSPDGAPMPAVHLMTVDASVLYRLKEGQGKLMDGENWSSTVWRSGDKVHLAAVRKGSQVDPKTLFPFG